MSKTNNDEEADEGDVLSHVQRPLRQSFIVDYPLVAYKYFSGDDSEIAIANFAQSADTQCIVHLGAWQFLAFVGAPKPMEVFGSDTDPLMSHIFLLARHR